MKFVAGVTAGIMITVLGQWVLQATPDAPSAAAHASRAWSWAQDVASARLWWFVTVLGVLALLTFAGSVFAVLQDDWLTEHIGFTLGLIGLTLTAALAVVVAAATDHSDRAITAALMIAGLVPWIVRRSQVVRRAVD